MTDDLFLSLGSNQGDRKQNITLAYDQIEANIGPILQKSSFLENEAVGFETEDLFLNTCIQVRTLLTPLEILDRLKKIENSLGRIQRAPDANYQSRCIDIDIILLGNLILESEKLTIPHFHFRQRKFVLIPLAEIAPNHKDPSTHLTINQLLNISLGN